MNKEEAFALLSSAFAGCLIHPLFLKELKDLLSRDLKGKEKNFFSCLVTQLNCIKVLGVMVYNADDHEKLLGFDGHYYSIHLRQKQFNIRFLVHINDDGTPIFLAAFNERAGHSATSYKKYTAELENRYQEMQGGNDNE